MQIGQRARQLTAQTNVSANGNDSAVEAEASPDAYMLTLDVTAAATVAGDVLDVYVDTKLDEANWVEIVRFPAIAGDGGALRYTAKLRNNPAQPIFEHGTGLAAASTRDLWGHEFRVRWEVTTVDTPLFDFTVHAQPM